MTDSKISGSLEDVQKLRHPRTIRERCQLVLQKALEGGTGFSVDLDAMSDVVAKVKEVTTRQYPDFKVPFHSRWRHFEAGGHDRVGELRSKFQEMGMSSEDQGVALLDLAIVSVLLDAGAGPDWEYKDSTHGESYNRSEGLAIASFDMFVAGAFSNESENPYRVDQEKLLNFTVEELKSGFKVRKGNPLVGLEGRTELLVSLAKDLDLPQFEGQKRPGGIYSYLVKKSSEKRVSAVDILTAVQEGLGGIWPGRFFMNGVNLGDIWPCSALGESKSVDNLVPFHKLSQWLSYSLMEPLEWAGYEIDGIDELTGLAEYRNGGLFLDMGVLKLRNPNEIEDEFEPSSQRIIEWRALTIALLDRVAEIWYQDARFPKNEWPLVKILEGGTWTAGRELAAEKRGGLQPFQLKSDGTVF